MDYVEGNIRFWSEQLTSENKVNLTVKGFKLFDMFISNNSPGKVTLLVTDDKRTHVIKVIKELGDWSFSSVKGLLFWKGSRLQVVKESSDGVVDVGFSYIDAVPMDYSVWRLR